MSRTENSIKNMAVSFGGQILNNLLRLLCRTAFIYTLGKEYLGISSLYTNILTLLSVSELGLGAAITYSLYRPLAVGDKDKIRALMGFFKKAYQTIGLVILAAGVCLLPVLPKLLNGSTDKVNIYLYYLLYLAQTVASYLFFAYKRTLLEADQKKYVTDTVSYLAQLLMNLLQICILFWTRSFFWYTMLAVIRGIAENLVVSWIVDRRYPWLKTKQVKMEAEDRRAVLHQVFATVLNKIAVAISTSTDNLIISANLSVLLVGLYDNYYTVISAIQSVVVGIQRAFAASLGNYYATQSKDENYFLFRSLNLMNWIVVVFCSVCFLVLFQPFIQLWIGVEYLLDYPVLITIVLNFSTNYMLSTVQIFKDSSGLFVRGKYRPAATAVLNLVISLILVRVMGMAGVFLGSVFSRLLTTWWYDVWLVHRIGFERSPRGYFFGCVGMHILIGILAGVITWVSSFFHLSFIGELLLRGGMSIVLVSITFLVLYGRSREFQFLLQKAKMLLLRKL